MINIIGAGPIGCHTAFLLGKNGYEVRVFEEHKEIGTPIQCTGLVTGSISDIVKLPHYIIVNKIGRVKVFSPKGECAEIRLKKKELVVDRTFFDNFFYEKAQDKADFQIGKKIGKIENNSIIIDGKDKKSATRKGTLIGADGPNSVVAKAISDKNRTDYLVGMQARVQMELEPDAYETYFGSICPGFFAWVVPEDNKTARIGLATKTKANYYFKQFIKKRAPNAKILDMQSGLIPMYNPGYKTQKKDMFVVGDAATQVKATTGGGLIPGLLCAEKLAEAIDKKKSYPKMWKAKIGKTLWLHHRIRKMLNRFTNKDYEKLIQMLAKEKIKKTLAEESREFPLMMVIKMLLKEPKLLGLSRRILI